MNSVRNKVGAGFFLVVLATVCSAFQPPAKNATLPVSGYVLGPDDQIVIHSIDASEVSNMPLLVGMNGEITLPLIGRVKAGGLTVEQLETELNTRLKKYFKQPQVSVTVVEFRSQPVSVFGSVSNPGVFQLRGRKTLYEVLAMAGGPREATGSLLTITRRRENGAIPLPDARTDSSGRFSTAELNLQEVLDGKNPAANIEIKPNDVVSVSTPESNMVFVVGDVVRGGGFSLGGRQSVSVLMALSMAGGLGRTAKPKRARIIRIVPGETEPREIAVNLQKVLNGKAEDIALRPQDVLVVPTSSRKSFSTYALPATLAAAIYGVIYSF